MRQKATCLFATHFHELTHSLEGQPGEESHVTAAWPTIRGALAFLYECRRTGPARPSFGIKVAELAGFPPRYGAGREAQWPIAWLPESNSGEVVLGRGSARRVPDIAVAPVVRVLLARWRLPLVGVRLQPRRPSSASQIRDETTASALA